MEEFSKTDLAREYRKKHGSEMPTLKLARIMFAENNLLFKHIEDARDRLRYIEGKHGKNTAGKSRNAEFIIEEARSLNPYKLPESDESSFEPFILQGFKRIALFSDIHLPYHNIDALSIAIQYCKREKPDLILLNGDTLDCYQMSRFGKDPKKRNFAHEIATLKQFFQVLNKEFGCQIMFKHGNHEERYNHFLQQKAGELIGMDEFVLDNIIKTRSEGIQIIGDKRIIHANNLNIIHGHEFSQGFFSPVNVARGLALRAKASAIQGHNHQSSEHSQVDINGKVMTTWSTGCLCELHPAYAPINNWNHGFAVIDLDSNGIDFEVRNKRIYKGKIL